MKPFPYIHLRKDATTMPTIITADTITCHTCRRAIEQREAQPICLLVPTSRYRNGRPVWHATGETAYECDACREIYASQYKAGVEFAEEVQAGLRTGKTFRELKAFTPHKAEAARASVSPGKYAAFWLGWYDGYLDGWMG